MVDEVTRENTSRLISQKLKTGDFTVVSLKTGKIRHRLDNNICHTCGEIGSPDELDPGCCSYPVFNPKA